MTRHLVQGMSTEENEDGHLVFVCLCDCATTTRMILTTTAEIPRRFAVTCDGCQTTHRLKYRPLDGLGKGIG